MDYVSSLINDTYEIVLPDFRKAFHADRPNWEKGRLESCRELMKPGMTVYDIGAEHGDFTSLYKLWVGDTGTVVPIEPAAHYWSFIRETWEANNFSSLPELMFVGLIGDTDNRDRLFDSDFSGWPDQSFNEGVPDGGFLHLAHDQISSRTTIDDISSHLIPDAIVIDIEGAEWHACNGAWIVLEGHRPLVWVSVHPPTMWDWYQKTPDDLLRLFEEVEYDHTILPHHGEGEDFYLFTPR